MLPHPMHTSRPPHRRLRALALAWMAGFCLPAAADDLTPMRAALQAVAQGTLSPERQAALAGDPLYPWLEYAVLTRDIATLPPASAEDFLRRNDGMPVASLFRSQWLKELARRQDWPTLLTDWAPTDNTALRCARLQAQQQSGKPPQDWNAQARAIWRSSGKSLPDACDPVFATLAQQGGLSDALRWERIDLAIDAGQGGVIRAIARGLATDQQPQANAYAAYLDQADGSAAAWPRTPRSRRVAVAGLSRLAVRDPAQAEALLPVLADALDLRPDERAQVRYQIALWTVASYGADSARRLAAVPDSAYDERLHEWQAREAMARGDWAAAREAIRRMPPAQRDDPRWRYYAARMDEMTGKPDEARKLFTLAAKSPTFHGFLAADRIDAPYALCPWTPEDSAAARAAVAADPGLSRALALYRLSRPDWAVREWSAALAKMDDTRRRLAVEAAQEAGWFDRAVFALGKTPDGQPRPDELRLYTLRFPLHHADAIRREAARSGIDPTWVAAEIRAESVFDPNARSAADARGLMQVVPATGAAIARQLALPGYVDGSSLYDPDMNIAIGSAYLRQLLDRYGAPYIAMAAYNAGPGPAQRWLGQRPDHDADIWIETVSYKETREYVARILAFSVLYDWRLNGNALPVSERMLGQLSGTRKAFACPAVTTPSGL